MPPIWKPALPEGDIAPHAVVGGYVSWKVPWYIWPMEICYMYEGQGKSGIGTRWGLPTFSDLNAGHRFYLPVGRLFYRGIVNGYPDGTFRPQTAITVAQFAKMLVLADAPYNKATFTYPAGYLSEAKDAGFLTWESKSSSQTLTRLEVVQAVARIGKNALAIPPASYKLPFTDVPAAAETDLALLAYNGVISGGTATRFNPQAACSRGQASKMLSVMLDPCEPYVEPVTTTTLPSLVTTTTTLSQVTVTTVRR